MEKSEMICILIAIAIAFGIVLISYVVVKVVEYRQIKQFWRDKCTEKEWLWNKPEEEDDIK